MTARLAVLPAALLVAFAAARPAAAEIVILSSGRTVSVKAHRIDGDSIVLQLRSGGEITCQRALVTSIEPDEVPFPEPDVPVSLVESAPPAPVPFGEMIEQVASQHDVDAKLVRAMIQVESDYQPRARSAKGAVGLMQLMPQTARQYAVSDPYDPRANIEGGIKHLKALLERFTLPLALAAYNAGEDAVQRFGGVPPYPETRSYVARVLRLVGR